MSRRVRADRRYNQPYRLTGYPLRAILKWAGLVLAWIIAIVIVTSVHLGFLVYVSTGGLIWYAVHSAGLGRPRLTQQWTSLLPYQPIDQSYQLPIPFDAAAGWQFFAPPGWPQPPAGWSPPPGWQPDPSWPSAPPGWQFWMQVPPGGAAGERNSRTIPQDVKIAGSVGDQGTCVQCGSREDLPYDRKIPWSTGSSNTVNNRQLLCGRCNRLRGADDIPV